MGNLLRLLTREDQDSSGGKGDIFLDFESKYLSRSALCGRALLVIGHVKVAHETGLVLRACKIFFYFNRTPDKERGFGTAQLRKTCTNLAQYNSYKSTQY